MIPTLKQIKTVFNFIKKQHHLILTHVFVNNDKLQLTDTDTMLEINSTFGLENGFHAIKTLGLAEPNRELNIFDYPDVFDFQIDTMYEFTWSQKGIASFFPFMSKDETRPVLNSVAINDSHLVATSGHILKYVELFNKSKCNYVMPVASLKILDSLLKKFKIKNDFTVLINGTWMIVKNEYFNFKARLIIREYPKWQAIIPTSFEHEFTIDNWINVKKLKTLFDPKNNAITIETKKKQLRAIIKGHDEIYTIGYCNEDINFNIGFNAELFDLCMEKNKKVILKFNNNISPIAINNTIVMPLKI